MLMHITNRVFVVTGAGNGMGREVALGLARRGAHVAAGDLDHFSYVKPRRVELVDAGFVRRLVGGCRPLGRGVV